MKKKVTQIQLTRLSLYIRSIDRFNAKRFSHAASKMPSSTYGELYGARPKTPINKLRSLIVSMGSGAGGLHHC
jgi:hypothetical protein